MSKSKIFPAVVLILTLCIHVVGCSNLTQENYNKIKVGMSLQEVEKLLGSSPTCDSALGTKKLHMGN